jgi:hypothetical protein
MLTIEPSMESIERHQVHGLCVNQDESKELRACFSSPRITGGAEEVQLRCPFCHKLAKKGESRYEGHLFTFYGDRALCSCRHGISVWLVTYSAVS